MASFLPAIGQANSSFPNVDYPSNPDILLTMLDKMKWLPPKEQDECVKIASDLVDNWNSLNPDRLTNLCSELFEKILMYDMQNKNPLAEESAVLERDRCKKIEQDTMELKQKVKATIATTQAAARETRLAVENAEKYFENGNKMLENLKNQLEEMRKTYLNKEVSQENSISAIEGSKNLIEGSNEKKLNKDQPGASKLSNLGKARTVLTPVFFFAVCMLGRTFQGKT